MYSIRNFFMHKIIRSDSTNSLEYHCQNDNNDNDFDNKNSSRYVCKNLNSWFSNDLTFKEYSERYNILNKWNKCNHDTYHHSDYSDYFGTDRWTYNISGKWKNENITKLPEKLQVLIKTEDNLYKTYHPELTNFYHLDRESKTDIGIARNMYVDTLSQIKKFENNY
jgi:hypothetical protein